MIHLITAIPLGTTRVYYRDQPYQLTHTVHNNGKSHKLYAAQENGNDIISANYYLTSTQSHLIP